MRTATERRTGRHLHHVRFVGGGVALAFWFAGWSVSGPVPEPTPGSATCRVMANATAEDYLTGVACPPVGFRDLLGYDPVLVSTPWGWRYTRPERADGRCSGPLGAVEGVMRFDTACRTHDYGYDLVRRRRLPGLRPLDAHGARGRRRDRLRPRAAGRGVNGSPLSRAPGRAPSGSRSA
jgi:hypothetical protein